MKRIAIVTATRAEYGLLSRVIVELRKYENPDFKVELVVTGTHLSKDYGYTIDEIIANKVRIDYQIPIMLKSGSELAISENQADTLVKFTKFFCEKKFCAVVLLGDRYETFAIAIAASNARTPIFHMCGGDVTEGAMDEWMRHSITKMSYLHFPTNEDSKRRVIQLGENPDRVFNYGSTSIDNIVASANMSKEEALHSIGLKECRYALCTYHPVTAEKTNITEQMEALFGAIEAFPEMIFIVTKSNADQGGAEINTCLDQAEERIDNLYVYSSLGVRRYLSLMKHAEFVLGNSSSGMIETPSFHIPTINIGKRQQGRLWVESIINCEPDERSIIDAIYWALSKEMKEKCGQVLNPYGDGHAAVRIAKKMHDVIQKEEISLIKPFY